MDLLTYVEKSQLKKSIPKIKPGNIVAVHQKIREGKKERVQIFKGIVLKVKGGYGLNGSFTVRRIASGVGVEKTFLFHSPLIEKIVVLKQAKVRRAKLYYLRGRFGKAAKLNLMDESGAGVEELVSEIVGEDVVEEVKSEKAEVEGEEKVEKSETKDEVKEEKAEIKEEKTEKKEKKSAKKE